MMAGSGWLALIIFFAVAGCTDSSDRSGFAGLAGQVGAVNESDFEQPGAGDTLVLPGDWGPHPRHRIEWWYLTANLTTSDGKPLGVQWTQFRQALKPRATDSEPPAPETWPLEAAWMAHGAVSFAGQHWFAEKLARGDVGNAGATAEPFNVWLDNWRLQPASDSDAWRLQVQGDDWSYDLKLVNTGNVIAHGDQGFSAKSASGEGSMYFSLVDMQIDGQVTLGDRVLEVSGQGWFDREWSSQFLKAGQQGWDWFALHLDSGDKLMLFRLRDEGGDFLSGSWISGGQQIRKLEMDQIQMSELAWTDSADGRVPTRFRLQIPSASVNLEVAAPAGDYWNSGLYPYWESPVTVEGSHSGVGYMELTGY